MSAILAKLGLDRSQVAQSLGAFARPKPQSPVASGQGYTAADMEKAQAFVAVKRFRGKKVRRHLSPDTLPKVGAKRHDFYRFRQGMMYYVPGTNIPYWSENWLSPEQWKRYRAAGKARRKKLESQPTGRLSVRLLAMRVGQSILTDHTPKAVENLLRYLRHMKRGRWSRQKLSKNIRLTRIA